MRNELGKIDLRGCVLSLEAAIRKAINPAGGCDRCVRFARKLFCPTKHYAFDRQGYVSALTPGDLSKVGVLISKTSQEDRGAAVASCAYGTKNFVSYVRLAIFFPAGNRKFMEQTILSGVQAGGGKAEPVQISNVDDAQIATSPSDTRLVMIVVRKVTAVFHHHPRTKPQGSATTRIAGSTRRESAKAVDEVFRESKWIPTDTKSRIIARRAARLGD